MTLSEPVYAVDVSYDVPVRMRDGTVLRADVYRPASPGRYPVLLERVAYELRGRCAGSGNHYAQRGYVFVGQNVRGRFASEGVFDPFRDDGWGTHQDGYASVEWAAAQRWSNGSVAAGLASPPASQVLPAAERHRPLVFRPSGPSGGRLLLADNVTRAALRGDRRADPAFGRLVRHLLAGHTRPFRRHPGPRA